MYMKADNIDKKERVNTLNSEFRRLRFPGDVSRLTVGQLAKWHALRPAKTRFFSEL